MHYMSNCTYWLTPNNTILVLTLPKYYTWAEVDNWMEMLSQELDLCEHPVSVVFDFQKSTYIPNNVIKQTQKSSLSSHPMIASIILTNLSKTHYAVLNMLRRLYPQNGNRWVITDTLEDVVAAV